MMHSHSFILVVTFTSPTAAAAYSPPYCSVTSRKALEDDRQRLEDEKLAIIRQKENAEKMLSVVDELIKKHGCVNEVVRNEYKLWIKNNKDILSGGEAAYSLIDDNGNIYQAVSMAAPDKPETRSHKPLNLHPFAGTGQGFFVTG